MVKNQKPILNVMIIKTIKLPTLTLFFLFILAACEPVSEISHKDEIKAYHPFSIGLSLKSDEPLPAKDIGARLFEKYNLENTYTVEIIKISEALNQYELFSNNLGAGEYRLVVEVPYKIKLFGLTLIRATKLITHDFLIRKSLPYTCFNFNSQDDLNGWQSSPVYIENKDKPFSKPTCPGLFFVNNDWTVGLKQTTHGGSLFVPVSSECFPKSSNQLSKHNHWTFSIKSPELADNTDWQNLSAINFRVASSAMPLRNRAMRYQQKAGVLFDIRWKFQKAQLSTRLSYTSMAFLSKRSLTELNQFFLMGFVPSMNRLNQNQISTVLLN